MEGADRRGSEGRRQGDPCPRRRNARKHRRVLPCVPRNLDAGRTERRVHRYPELKGRPEGLPLLFTFHFSLSTFQVFHFSTWSSTATATTPLRQSNCRRFATNRLPR